VAMEPAPIVTADTPIADEQPAAPVGVEPAAIQAATDPVAVEPAAPTEAGEQSVEPVTDVSHVEPPAEGVDASVRTSEAGTQLISISLEDVALEDVVRMFTRISGANIIASGTNLEGTVTVNLIDVEWKPALSSILDMHSLALVEKIPGSGVYSIVPKQANVPEPMIVETVFLNYTTVDEVQPVIKNMLAQGGLISPFNSRNAMVIRTTSGNLGEIKQVLKLIDIPGQQVCIETQFMELSDTASKQLGVDWQGLESFGAKLDLGPFSYDRTATTKNSDDDSYKRTTDNSTSDKLSETYDANGIQYDTGSDAAARTITDTISSGESGSTETLNNFTELIVEKQSAILEMDSFNVVLSALKKTEGVSIVSNPKLIVANGETAAFFSVGSREPIIKSEITRATVDGQKDTVTSELDTNINTDYIKQGYLETGITLKVVPVIKSEGLIEALIEPSLRRKTGDKTVDQNSWPIIDVKEIKTRFTLRDKQTVAIGGLTASKDSQKTSKIPLLGDIPLIGKYLFSHTSDSKDQVETIIFVTLSLAQPERLGIEEAIPKDGELVYKRMLKEELRRKEFQDDMARMRQAAAEELGTPAPAPVAPEATAPTPGTNTTTAAPAVN
jgi:type II secretory pathway component GspD/PulD (secretin)